jgi:hypothetical protein
MPDRSYACMVSSHGPAKPQVDNLIRALVAQRIEHLTTDQKVGGSSPSERATVPAGQRHHASLLEAPPSSSGRILAASSRAFPAASSRRSA